MIDKLMRDPAMGAQRESLLAQAEGNILEIGVGSGLNLRYYTDKATKVSGIDPVLEFNAKAQERADKCICPVDLIPGSAEDLPFADGEFDTVVTTWTLCTIPDAPKALREMRRVLKDGGKLLFVEHGYSDNPGTAKWQNRINPVWKCFAGGCNLNRKMDEMVKDAGFAIGDLETMVLDISPKIAAFTYRGVAGRG